MNAARTHVPAEPNGLATSWDPPTNFAKLENSPNWLKNPHRLWLENKIRVVHCAHATHLHATDPLISGNFELGT